MKTQIAAAIAIVIASTQYAVAASSRSEGALCAIVKQRVAATENGISPIPVSKWWCDFIADKFQPDGYWLVQLHSGGVSKGSDLIDTYVIRLKDGRAIHWDTGKMAPGKPL